MPIFVSGCILIVKFEDAGDADGKASAYNVGDLDLIPRSVRSTEEGNGNPLHSLPWKIPWMEEPGTLQSMGLQRIGGDQATSLSLSFIFMF